MDSHDNTALHGSLVSEQCALCHVSGVTSLRQPGAGEAGPRSPHQINTAASLVTNWFLVSPSCVRRGGAGRGWRQRKLCDWRVGASLSPCGCRGRLCYPPLPRPSPRLPMWTGRQFLLTLAQLQENWKIIVKRKIFKLNKNWI